jgi:DNA-binding cell septation regulator SpoVG
MTKGSWGKIRAFFDLQTNEGFTIKGFKLVEGINGLFVGFPSQKGSDDEYRDTVWAERELKDELTQLAIKEYGQEVMSPPVGMEEDSFSPPPPLETAESPVVAEPFSDDDIPF